MFYSVDTGNYLQKILISNMLEDLMFAVLFILEYVIEEPRYFSWKSPKPCLSVQ